MSHRNWLNGPALLLAWVWLAACGCTPSSPSTPPTTTAAPVPTPTPTPTATPAKLMVVTHTTGFRHSSITVAEPIIRNIAISSGLYDTEFCRNAADVQTMLTTTHLAGVDAVFFANTTGDLGIPDVRAFVDWVSAGHAFLGAHGASDTYHASAEYVAMCRPANSIALGVRKRFMFTNGRTAIDTASAV